MKNKLFNDYYHELLEILNCIKVGIYITDGKGNTILVNDESCRTGGLTREEVIGKNMKELEHTGFVKESVSLKALANGREENLVQDLGDGGKVFVVANPKYKDGAIDYVLCTERDITETVILKEVLKEKEKVTEKYEKEIAYLQNRNIAIRGNIVTSDVKSRIIMDKVLRVAGLDTTVLLIGESGTGKEVYANILYKNSKRVGKSFIKVNCAAIPEKLLESEMFGYEKGAFTGADKNGKMGFFELANGGTLFLDEIGDLPIHLQSKLLRALQEREIMRVGGHKTIPLDIRLIVATNMDLVKAIEEGRFREDLYYRLNVMPIEIPALRDRKQDIGPIAKSYVEALGKEYKIYKKLTSEAIEVLESYPWLGNVRELQNVIERSVISFDGEQITKFQLEKLLYPKPIREVESLEDDSRGEPLENLLERYEKKIIKKALEKCKNAHDVALYLGMNKSTLCRRMQKYGLK